MEKKLKKTIILFGIKHCGKSTHGRGLADFFGCPFFDTDEEILHSTGKTAREIYSGYGEKEFRTAEESACRVLAGTCLRAPAVIATGGGICNNHAAIALLRPVGVFVFLSIDEDLPAERIVREAVRNSSGMFENIPAYIAEQNPRTEEDIRRAFHRFFSDRTLKYEQLADYTIRMEQAPVRTNTERIRSVIESAVCFS
jgi:shikimate kinase